FSRSRRFAN
ncbi:hypothetical protein D043_3872B, partial [Vibrio parahaemolyticus EKP-021]